MLTLWSGRKKPWCPQNTLSFSQVSVIPRPNQTPTTIPLSTITHEQTAQEMFNLTLTYHTPLPGNSPPTASLAMPCPYANRDGASIRLIYG
jgi:hypothetical protein